MADPLERLIKLGLIEVREVDGEKMIGLSDASETVAETIWAMLPREWQLYLMVATEHLRNEHKFPDGRWVDIEAKAEEEKPT